MAGSGERGGSPWWALAGVSFGIVALVALVVVAAAAPIDSEAAASQIGIGAGAGDFELRSAAVLIVIGAVAALFASSAIHSRRIAVADESGK